MSTVRVVRRRGFPQVSIKHVIFAGFLVLIAMIAGSTMLDIFAMRGVRDDFAALQRQSAASAIGAEIAAGAAALRQAARDFISDQAIPPEQIIALVEELKRRIGAARPLFGAEQIDMLDGMDERLATYRRGFERIVALEQQRDQRVAELRQALAQATASAKEQPAEAAAESAEAMSAGTVAMIDRLLDLLIHRGLEKRSSAAVLEALDRDLASLQAGPQADELKRLVPTLLEARRSFGEIEAEIRQLDAEILGTEGRLIDRTTARLRQSASRTESEVAGNLSLTLDSLSRGALLFGTAFILIGLLTATFVTRRFVRPLSVLTGALIELGRAARDVVVPYQRQGNEIGDIARAVDAFRTTSVELENERRKLRESEARYALITDAATEGIYDWNIAGGSLYISPRLNALVGLDEGEGIDPAEWPQRIHPDDRKAHRDALVAHLKGETGHLEVEYRVLMKDGGSRWFLDHGTAVAGEGGRAARLVGALSDVDDRKKAEQALAQSEERYKLAMQAVNEGVYDWNLATGEIYLSPRVFEVLGCLRSELTTAADWYARIHPEDAERYRRATVAHLKGETPRFECEFRYRDPTGAWRWASQHGIALRGADRRAYRMTGSIGDISEQVELARALAENKQRLQVVIDAMPASVNLKDSTGRYILMNRHQAQVFGTTPEDAVGKTSHDILAPQGLAKSDRGDAELLRTGLEQGFYEDEFRDARHVLRTWLTKKVPVTDAAGTIVNIVTVALDITDRKAAERELEAAEAATKAKSQLLAIMSHEIRTPMNGVLGMIELLEQSRLDADQQRSVEIIRDSATALLRIINDILDVSKLDAGRLELEEIPLSVEALVEGVAESLAPAARAKDLTLHVFVDPQIPASVIGDPVRLRQILVNLGGNAVKFAERGDVRIRAVLAGRALDHAQLRISVADTGMGIDKEALARLFQPFQQATTSISRRFGGTGLGLSICRRLVELMDGRLEVESAVGIGSVFTVDLTLPIAPAGPRRQSIEPDLSDLAVLLVAEDATIRGDLASYLGAAGAVVTQAASRRDLADAPADVIVLDGGPLVRVAGGRMVMIGGADGPAADVTTTPRPVRRAALVQAVGFAAGRSSPLPLTESSPAVGAMVAPSVEEALRSGRLILVADDHPTNRTVLLRQINQLGYAAEAVADGNAALAALRAKRYALLLTDCHMPGLDGFELTAHLREEERRTGSLRLPIIAVTANALLGEAERCLAAGMDHYLSKPVSLGRLREALRRWMPKAGPATAEGDPEAEADGDEAPAAALRRRSTSLP